MPKATEGERASFLRFADLLAQMAQARNLTQDECFALGWMVALAYEALPPAGEPDATRPPGASPQAPPPAGPPSA